MVLIRKHQIRCYLPKPCGLILDGLRIRMVPNMETTTSRANNELPLSRLLSRLACPSARKAEVTRHLWSMKPLILFSFDSHSGESPNILHERTTLFDLLYFVRSNHASLILYVTRLSGLFYHVCSKATSLYTSFQSSIISSLPSQGSPEKGYGYKSSQKIFKNYSTIILFIYL